MTEVELPFDTKQLHYLSAVVHDDYLEILMSDNGKVCWYVYDMHTESWEEKDFQWQKGSDFDFRGKLQYDSKGNRYLLMRENSQEDNAYNIYKLNDDGTLECYVEFEDYISDFGDVYGGWTFLEDDRILVSVKYKSESKASESVIIDPVKQELQETYMEDIFMFYNLLTEGSLYLYPVENENLELTVRVGDFWDYKKKQEIQSEIELNPEIDPSAVTLPLVKEEKNYYSFSKYGIYTFTLEDEKMSCIVPSEVMKKTLSKYHAYTAAYKAEGENKFFILGQADQDIDLYKID